MAKSLRERDVVRMFDLYTAPRKEKIHICVSFNSGRWLSLRVNSNDPFGLSHRLLREHNDFLHHDSYVELQQVVRHLDWEISDAKLIGRLSEPEAKKLIVAVQVAETLPDDTKRDIAEGLS